MDVSSKVRGWLEECDIASIRKFWNRIHPNLPQPKNNKEALISIHIARTQSESVHFKHRAYSHSWLLDNGLPSMLPNRLRPAAERLHPTIKEAVGVSINTTSNIVKPAIPIIRGEVTKVICDIYADTPNPEPSFVKKRIIEVKNTIIKKLFGDIRGNRN